MRKDVKAALDAMIDKVLAYKPEPAKVKSKKRRRKSKQDAQRKP